MNPFAFVGVLAALLAATGRSRHRPNAPIPAAAVVAVVMWMVFVPTLALELVLLVHALRVGELGQAAAACAWIATTSLVLFPWPIARAILIPLGQIRLTWALNRLSFWVWRGDVKGGAVVAASWAAIRQVDRGRALSPEQIEWIERRLAASSSAEVRWQLGGAGIVASGLLAEARGERARARQLLVSAGELAEPTWPAQAIVVAWTWLCGEAIGRGAWREVECLARTAPLASRTSEFLGAVAARLTGIAPLPGDTVLQWRWLLAPHRRATRPLLRRALATPAVARQPPPTEAGSPEGDDSEPGEPELRAPGQTLTHALELHARALATTPAALSRRQVIALARAWDAALVDPSLGETLDVRADALGAHAQSAAELAALVRDDLLALIEDAGLELGPLGEHSELLGRAARRLHGELLDGLEISIGALESRVDQTRELPALSEWQEFLAIREQYARAVSLGGLQLRRLAFSIVHGPLCSLAVWLWNERRERAIANAMFQWLLAEAVVVADSKAVELQEKNVKCGV